MEEPFVVAALNIGALYSGVAFSFKSDPEHIRHVYINHVITQGNRGFNSYKIPTCLLLDRNRKLVAIGYEAEDLYADALVDREKDIFYFFRKFTMQLYSKDITDDMMLKDVTGKFLPAFDILKLFIETLVGHLVQYLQRMRGSIVHPQEVQWVLTVPVYWTDTAKQLIRSCAEESGIHPSHLKLVPETESALFYCKMIQEHHPIQVFQERRKYMVVDLGGCVIDITVLDIKPNQLIEKYHTEVINRGGTSVNKVFFKVLDEMCSVPLMYYLKKEYPLAYLDIEREFEMIKRERTDEFIRLTVPLVSLNKVCNALRGKNFDSLLNNSSSVNKITCLHNKIQIEDETYRNLFKSTIDYVISGMEQVFIQYKNLHNVTHIVMIGGFSQCGFVQDAVKQKFPSKCFIIPEDPELAAVKGAVLWGHQPQMKSPGFVMNEENNFAKMGMIMRNILTDVLYDLLKPDEAKIRPRNECDIPFLYRELRKPHIQIPYNRLGCTLQTKKASDIGDDIDRILLIRNELQHSRTFKLDGTRYIHLCDMLTDILKRFDHCNKPNRLYTDQLKEIMAKAVTKEEVKVIRHQIENEMNSDSLLMSSIVYDGHAIDCMIDRRLVDTHVFSTKTIKDFTKLKEYMEERKTNEFQNLVIVSSFLKGRKRRLPSLDKEMLIHCVKTKQDLLCRLTLSYIIDRKNALQSLFDVLSIAIEDEENGCAKAIAWFITRNFFLENKGVLLQCTLDIWPAFKCKCIKNSEQQVCSSHVVIVVELESEINKERIPDKYFSVEVVYLINGISHETNTKTELQDSVTEVHFPDNKPITGLSASDLFAKHRKLTLISKSSFQQHGIEKQCVNLFCRVKGLIPIGENHLPRSFCSLPTKIQQGRPQLMTNIRVGDKIGTDDFKKGTLGGFLKVRGDKVFLTCLHILLSTDDLASENITLNDEQPLSIKCYPAVVSSAASNTTSYVCGKIRDIAFKTDNCESTSIDAALIKVKKGIEICPTDYAVTGNENTVNHGQIGLHSPFLNNSCVDFRQFCYAHPKPSVTAVSVGAISGMNEVGSEIMENMAFGTDLEPFNKSFDNVFLDGMTHIATCVIESIRRSRNRFIPLEKQIRGTVENQCKGHFTTKTKKNIAKIVYEVYTKIESTGQGDAQLEVKELLHKATFGSTSSSFSAIVGDVHLQKTFLKWTVDRETSKRTSRKMYGQIHISNIPFQPGDSGSCIYVTHPEKGCIGLAIANHPNGGCIATPIMEILKHFNIRQGPNQ